MGQEIFSEILQLRPLTLKRPKKKNLNPLVNSMKKNF